jgi:hypothetical protein
MNILLRVLVGLPAIMFIVIGLGWLVEPAAVAAQFGMPLLDGLGLSTQIGDLGAFFVSGGSMVLLGLFTAKRQWFLAPAMLLGTTAVFRTLAWLLQDASLAIPQIVVEVVVCALLLVSASRLAR